MNKEKQLFNNLAKPQVKSMQSHKRRLKVALLTAHEHSSYARTFRNVINDFIKNMSLGKKSTAITTMVLFGLVVTAGIIGPSAADVAQAEAQTTVRRAFARFANLSDQEKADMEEKFQDCVHFRSQEEPKFHRMDEISDQDRQARHEEIKSSLIDSLAEAQSADDLEVVSAPEMPMRGFMGKAGRAFGFKMMEESTENLPKDIQEKIREREELRADMEPVKWLKYTNSEGKVVSLGLNANDEPVVKFIEGEFPFGRQNVMPKGHFGQ